MSARWGGLTPVSAAGDPHAASPLTLRRRVSGRRTTTQAPCAATRRCRTHSPTSRRVGTTFVAGRCRHTQPPSFKLTRHRGPHLGLQHGNPRTQPTHTPRQGHAEQLARHYQADRMQHSCENRTRQGRMQQLGCDRPECRTGRRCNSNAISEGAQRDAARLTRRWEGRTTLIRSNSEASKASIANHQQRGAITQYTRAHRRRAELVGRGMVGRSRPAVDASPSQHTAIVWNGTSQATLHVWDRWSAHYSSSAASGARHLPQLAGNRNTPVQHGACRPTTGDPATLAARA